MRGKAHFVSVLVVSGVTGCGGSDGLVEADSSLPDAFASQAEGGDGGADAGVPDGAAALPESGVRDAADEGRGDAVVDASADVHDTEASTPSDAHDSSATVDAGPDAIGVVDAGNATGPFYYGRVVTVTREVADHLRAVAAVGERNEKVFLKAGDSITSGTGPRGSFGCFASAEGATIDLGGADELEETITWFDEVELGSGQTSWNRDSLSALGGAGAEWVIDGDDESPLQEEIDAINPRFAVVMIGTNDVSGVPEEYGLGAYGRRDYAANLWEIVDRLEDNGVVPILTYFPPVNIEPEPNRTWIARDYVAVVRAIATTRKIPTIDINTEMDALGLPPYPDGIHPDSHPDGSCLLTGDGLEYGHNIRNLRSLEILHKVRRVVLDGVKAVDANPPSLAGTGTLDDPWSIPALPFSFGVTFEEGDDGPNDYTACGGHAEATGPATVFSFEVPEAMPVRVMAVPTTGACEPGEEFTDCDESTDIVVALYEDEVSPEKCLFAHSTAGGRRLEPGHTYYAVVDSYGDADLALLAVHPCHPDDPTCPAQ